MSDPKYKTLKELADAYKSGAIKREDSLILDNDNCTVYVPTEADPETYECMFRAGGPAELIEEALDMIGVPWDNA